ncbi:MAG: type II toxin-antitoxin system YafQ family toxin [Candidatus Electrothrix sp. Rat3]|nr:type II toxin-antitoxin system YafQ family toxin [Candidatus Electrothrix rattekaaiensis]
MRKVSQTRQFSRDLKRVAKRGKNLDKLKRVVTLLAKDQPLEPRHRDHALTGNWKYSRDCHIEPDWLLIYTLDDESLRLERTGTHSDLFKK